MSCGPVHRMGAAAAVGTVAFYAEKDNLEPSAKPLAATGLAYLCGTLPDIIEPASHPNHRQFFHSHAFAGVVGYGVYRTWKWETETENQKWVKTALLAIGGAYLVHLLMDSGTPKGLPAI